MGLKIIQKSIEKKLSELGISAIAIIEDDNLIKLIHKEDIKTIEELYKLIIKNCVILAKCFNFTQPAEIYSMYRYLLLEGYLSAKRNITFSQEEDINIQNLGAKVITGKCVCRHISAMLKDIYKEKMDSDRTLNDLNKEIGDINSKIQNGIYKEIIAGALVVKYNGVASIYVSGFNKSYNKLLPNHFLHYMLITNYKQEGFNFLDLNGMAGDFSKDSPYKGLNDFKMLWNPRVYEYLGEFDFILSYTKYSLLWTTKQLHKEFERSPRVI